MTVEEARGKKVCRICEQPIPYVPSPKGWEFEFNERIFPQPAITLKFGDEFAHTKCLNESTNSILR